MQIRRADWSDSAGILECLRLAFEPYRRSYTAEAFRDTVLDADTVRRRLEGMAVFVATEDNLIVGTIGCEVVNDEEGHLRGMAVRPEWQASGVARRLLDTAEAELSARGCRRVTLDTTRYLERAMRFYEKCGYRRTGRMADFFGMELLEYAKTLVKV